MNTTAFPTSAGSTESPGAPGRPGPSHGSSALPHAAPASPHAVDPAGAVRPVGTAGPNGTDRPRTLLGRWARGWWAVVHLVLDLPLGGIWILVPVFIVAGVLALPALGTGVLLILGGLWFGWCVAWVERRRAAAFLDVDVHRPLSDPRQPWWKKLFLDPVRWREAAGATLGSLWGMFIGTVVTALLAWAVALIVFPLYMVAVPDPHLALPWADWTPWGIASRTWEFALLWLAGLAILVAAPLAAPWLTRVDAAIIRWFFGESPADRMRALESRNATLDRSRAAAVDSVEAERRRIERDLHDGPQQKLVSVAMDIGLARGVLRPGAGAPDATAALGHLDRAHASAKEAITEMRQVARGIVPPILADRGLDAAFSALAVRAPIPVEVHVDPRIGRLDPSVEAIAYFCASEALTNVAKHAAARHARVVLVPADDASARVVLTIEDDGIGGARFPDERGPGAGAPGVVGNPGAMNSGTGLAGLRQRVAAVDGFVVLHSPPGGPTALTVVLPWRPAAGSFGGVR